MELLLLLPILAGVALVDFLFSGDDSGGATDDDNSEPTPTNLVKDGTSSDDGLTGASNDDFLLGGAGDDKLEGGKSNDLLLGEKGADELFGGIGYDTLLGGNGNDTIFGLTGKDFIIGGGGEDEINGGRGDDTISGSSGADKLEGGAGNDVISGIDMGENLDPLAVNLLADEDDAETAAEALASNVRSTFGADAADDNAGRLTEALTSGNSNTDDDALFGGRGDDTILGDLSDTMTGGEGEDDLQIIKSANNQVVTVTDFDPAQDKLTIYVPQGTNVTYTLVNGATPADGVSVTLQSGVVAAVLKGVSAADLPANLVTWVQVPPTTV
ncbi:MAG: calcium-binding protein [Cypionkella sp.]|nr:calcium-binding protein [Cypionkella sp.]